MARTRRNVLATSAGALAVVAAGCGVSDLDERVRPDPPLWQHWVPAEIVTDSDASLIHINTHWARDRFSGFYEQLSVSETADSLGIDPAELGSFLTTSEENRNFSVFTGGVDREAIRETHKQAPEGEYRGYDLFRNDDRGDTAVGESLVIVADNVEQVIDVIEDELGYLGDVEHDWNEMLSYLDNPAFGSAQVGLPDGAALSRSPERTVTHTGETSSEDVSVTNRLQYPNSEVAADVVGENDPADFETFFSWGITFSGATHQGREIIVEGRGPRDDAPRHVIR